MAAKLKVLRRHWNNDTLDDFFANHCSEHAEVNFYIELNGKEQGGRWSHTQDIRLFREKYPQITSEFLGLTYPAKGDSIYTLAEFARTLPPEPEEGWSYLGPPASRVLLAIRLEFETEDDGRTAWIAKGKRNIRVVSLREYWRFEDFFEN
jgi:hypothetical protein